MRGSRINDLLAVAVAVGATSLMASASVYNDEEPRGRRKPLVRRAVAGHAEIVEWNRKVEEKRRAKKAQKGKR